MTDRYLPDEPKLTAIARTMRSQVHKTKQPVEYPVTPNFKVVCAWFPVASDSN